MQQSLFRPALTWGDDVPVDPMEMLRPYQCKAALAVMASLRTNRSCLVVMATGLGKTELFLAVSKMMGLRTLILAERVNLVHQTAKRSAARLNEAVEIEQGDWRASGQSRVIVASKDSLRSDRLDTLVRKGWTPELIIADESHHAVGDSYTHIFDRFPGARLYGTTATPDRADEQALGKIFEDVAFVYELDDAIAGGWLVPIRVKRRIVESIKLDTVGMVGKDFSQEQLDQMMMREETLHQIASDILEFGGGRRGFVFLPGVESSRLQAEVLNYKLSGSAVSVDNGTPHGERDAIYAAHQRGEFLFLCNVNIVTEGHDDPGASLMVNASPTKSRPRYAQRAGRVTRPLAGLVDAHRTDRAARLAAIAASGKPNCLVLDMVGSSSKHELVGPEDILGGKLSAAVAKRAKAMGSEQGGDVADLLKGAEAAMAYELEEQRRMELRRKAKVSVTVKGRVVEFDPFSFYRIENKEDSWGGTDRYGFRAPTEKMVQALRNRGIDVGPATSFKEASTLLEKLKGRPTVKMVQSLDKKGIDAREWSFELAGEALTWISERGWGRPVTPSEAANWQQRGRDGREPGEDG